MIGPEQSGYNSNLPNSINTNHVASAVYMNLGARYRLPSAGERNIELFAGVQNLLDRDPPVAPSNQGATNMNPVRSAGASVSGGRAGRLLKGTALTHNCMRFTWSPLKAAVNRDEHGVTFEEAASCFADRHQIAFYDPDHSDDEDRELLIAHSSVGRLLLVSYTARGTSIRIISARRATRHEASTYAQGI